jgi:large repetitive protein
MPYNPALNPYIINPKELPANQAAAGAVPAWNVGTANQWCQSPFYLPNWADSTGTPGTVATQAVSPVATASVGWPDALVNDRDVAANQALNAEKARQTSTQSGATNAITAINNLTGGAPGVFSVNPNTAVHAVATAVTIQGSGFTGATAVTIGGVACTGVTVVNDGEITCTTGTTTTAGAANVVVTTPAGTGTLTGGMTFT